MNLEQDCTQGLKELNAPFLEGKEKRLSVLSPSEIIAYNPDSEPVLVGDCHITRGEVFVIGGEPGVGKSRLAVSLALAGATGKNWLGLPVHQKFRTLILQTENGRYRLKKDFDEIGVEGLEDYLRISEPPPFGLDFHHEEFLYELKDIIESFCPDVILIDPWNSVATEDRQKEYLESFNAIRAVLPVGEKKPALGIVAHTRKPKSGESKNGGTDLMHTLAGSYVLSSVPRCVFIVLRATQDETNHSLVICNPKNNNGNMVAPSAWTRKNGLFEPISDFDWNEFSKPPDARRTITEDDIEEVLNGKGTIPISSAVQALKEQTGLKDSACYEAFKEGGKFDHLLIIYPKKLIAWKRSY